MIRVLFICHGNICRSTMAESVMTYLVEKEGLADKLDVYKRQEWNNEKGYLTDICLIAQDKYKAYLDCFRIAY